MQCLENEGAHAAGSVAVDDNEVMGAGSEARCVGIEWQQGKPRLTAVGAEDRSLLVGTSFALRLGDERGCLGAWGRSGRRPCPFGERIDPADTSAQCPPCAAADPGRFVARDAVLDNRRFHLYLAWFGPGLVKVGISAVHRGLSRLHEQGALASTWLATGDHAPIRQMELAIAEAGIAVERCRHETKLASWWKPSTPEQRHEELLTAHEKACAIANWPESINLAPCSVIDHMGLYGLSHLPAEADRVRALGPRAVIAGDILAVVGSNLLLHNSNGPLVVDTRLLAGWPITLTDATEEAGITRVHLHHQPGAHQQALF